ncbi:MAG: PhzF family phenazine biosynthesis protein [Opitutaceae bacterium]|nr:PhzF family phenazine biosynthesis protein [Cytophagales bacterium]
MKLPIYQVDAFTDTLFKGNPAAVCPLDTWLPDSTMQKIAFENNLAETAFFVKEGNVFNIRWFTPTVEVELCGHATIASVHVLKNHLNSRSNFFSFKSKSGVLTVEVRGNLYVLNFPSDKLEKVNVPHEFVEGLGAIPSEAFKGKTDYLLVFDSEDQIKQFQPDWGLLSQVSARGVCVTAKGNDCDFVSRFFAPQSGINEDPVTGSAHTTLVPYWFRKTGKNEFKAKQVSERGGELFCKYLGERIEIGGKAISYLEGAITI